MSAALAVAAATVNPEPARRWRSPRKRNRGGGASILSWFELGSTPTGGRSGPAVGPLWVAARHRSHFRGSKSCMTLNIHDEYLN